MEAESNSHILKNEMFTHDLFEDGAADARHGDAEWNLVAETTTELDHLQQPGAVHSLQSHHQQSADP